jgi:hypothetical protein
MLALPMSLLMAERQVADVKVVGSQSVTMLRKNLWTKARWFEICW